MKKTKNDPELNGSDKSYSALVQEVRAIGRATKAEALECKGITQEEARMLVGMYYSIQKFRMAAGAKVSAHTNRQDIIGPQEMAFLKARKEDLYQAEKNTAKGLKAFAEGEALGRWSMSNVGLGPVNTAGLLAHIDFSTCCCKVYEGVPRKDRPGHKCDGLATAGAIYKFAGLIDKKHLPWTKGQKRPYNAQLKKLCFLIGESFKRTSKLPDAFYGRLYARRKEQEVRRNDAGMYKELAYERLALAKEKKYNISPEQKETWGSGRLQAVGLDLRAMRYAVQIFLSHYHAIGRKLLGLPVVAPWVMVHSKQRAHYIHPPFEDRLEEIKAGAILKKKRPKVAAEETEDDE